MQIQRYVIEQNLDIYKIKLFSKGQNSIKFIMNMQICSSLLC